MKDVFTPDPPHPKGQGLGRKYRRQLEEIKPALAEKREVMRKKEEQEIEKQGGYERPEVAPFVWGKR